MRIDTYIHTVLYCMLRVEKDEYKFENGMRAAAYYSMEEKRFNLRCASSILVPHAAVFCGMLKAKDLFFCMRI